MPYPWEIMERACAGHRKGVAFDLHVSPTLVDRWCHEPVALGGDGEYSPLQRTLETIQSLRRQGSPGGEMIVQYLAAKTGYLPPVHSQVKSRSNELAIGETTRDFGAFLSDCALAMEDGIITLDEAKTLREDIRAVIESAMRIDGALDLRIAKLEADEARAKLDPSHNGSIASMVGRTR